MTIALYAVAGVLGSLSFIAIYSEMRNQGNNGPTDTIAAGLFALASAAFLALAHWW